MSRPTRSRAVLFALNKGLQGVDKDRKPHRTRHCHAKQHDHID